MSDKNQVWWWMPVFLTLESLGQDYDFQASLSHIKDLISKIKIWLMKRKEERRKEKKENKKGVHPWLCVAWGWRCSWKVLPKICPGKIYTGRNKTKARVPLESHRTLLSQRSDWWNHQLPGVGCQDTQDTLGRGACNAHSHRCKTLACTSTLFHAFFLFRNK